MEPLSPRERARYARQISLPAFGAEAQQRLKAASVLIVGAGGLGAPLSLYLAGAGIGRMLLVDDDVVSEANLHRQVLYTTADVGLPKAEVAAGRLHALNPYVRIEPVAQRLDEASAAGLVAQADIVADASDNFATRFLLAETSRRAGRPLVSASISGVEGQIAVFSHAGGPCYRCLYPAAPPAMLVPAGPPVLGIAAGLLGLLQAAEVLKLAAGIGRTLAGRLLLVDALNATFHTVHVGRRADCPACGHSHDTPLT